MTERRAPAKYVYGVVPAEIPHPRGTGIARRRLQTVQDGELAAIVSNVVDSEIEAGPDELLAHARVLERALEQGPVLPMRFGVVMSDEDAVRRLLLDDHREELSLQLQQLDGKAELHLRAIYDEQALMREVVADHPQIAALSASLRDEPAEAMYYERITLGEHVLSAVERAAEADLSAMLEELEPLAVAVVVGEREHERVAANISFLVEEHAIPSFDSAVDDLGRRNDGRLTFRYTGPLPAYSFVELPGGG